MRKIGSAVLLVLSVLLPSAATQAAAEKVDCSRLDLQFSPHDKIDRIECKVIHWSDPDDGAEGATAEFEILTADMGTHVARLSSVVAGKNTYFDKMPVSSKLRNWKELEGFTVVGTEPEFRRYQVIRFSASISETPMSCVGFMKYMGGAIGQTGSAIGAKGYLAGYDCWRDGPPDRAQIEATLDAIDD
ncbi:hypothetical protein FRZ44_31810 [Hypericibacter terrae]|uniref:Uncharacterized protein n=1 Tax=Hypericibacter terrae TaxID=2602015 RepID=A0A5J6MK71_9PROT|nr:hypothetical protein [Hypericibacter terrae]QEX17878.1 hypothetical protein FRZ44_31810 [Hypericibacter terrae]